MYGSLRLAEANIEVSSSDLLVVFKLLQRENVLVEIFLKLLVCIVDVELLEAVHLCEGTRESGKVCHHLYGGLKQK